MNWINSNRTCLGLVVFWTCLLSCVQGEQSQPVSFADKMRLHILAVDEDGDALSPKIFDRKEYTTGDSGLSADQKTLNWRKLGTKTGAVRKLPKSGLPDARPVEIDPDDAASRYDKKYKVLFEPFDPKGANSFKTYLENISKNIQCQRKQAESQGKRFRVIVHIHGGMNWIGGATERAILSTQAIQSGQFDDGIRMDPKTRNPVEQETVYYPIFVCWDSNPLSTYWHHLTKTRAGSSVNSTGDEWFGYLTAPLVLLGDVGSAIARGPENVLLQVRSDLETSAEIPLVRDVFTFSVQETYLKNLYYYHHLSQAKKDQLSRPTLIFDEGETLLNQISMDPNLPEDIDHLHRVISHRSPTEQFRYGVSYGLTAVPKMVAGSILNTAGGGAWREMKRRVSQMFWREKDFIIDSEGRTPVSDRKQTLHYRQPQGAVAQLTRMLSATLSSPETRGTLPMHFDHQEFQSFLEKSAKQHNSTQPPKPEETLQKIQSKIAELQGVRSGEDIPVTVIGHSMGAIVLNQMLRHTPEFHPDELVYFAAACEVRDFQATVLPYLKKHPGTHFYNLALHSRNETQELPVGPTDLVPRGSLLVWVDHFFERPIDYSHRTFGQTETAINVLSMISEEQGKQMTFKSFGVGAKGENPQRHSDFNNYQEYPEDHRLYNKRVFWNIEFWKNDLQE
ncbi:MAG: hypothetical protein AAF558_11995 [Verrucomicrobiota bacterium]